jgi:hypothetical protein
MALPDVNTYRVNAFALRGPTWREAETPGTVCVADAVERAGVVP